MPNPELDEQDRIESFTRLWVQHQRSVAAFIHMSLRDSHHAEDVLQEVAANASRNFGHYDPARSFEAWLIGIARKRLVDFYRKQGQQRVELSQDTLLLLDKAYAEAAEDIDDRVIALRKCMDRLPEHHKLLINRRYGFDDALADIAKSVGSTPKAVNAMLTRVRKLLADCVRHRMEASS